MRLAVMQPYIFPYIGYYQLISAVDKFVIYDDVNYINKGWINRNNVLINGKAGLFTVPLKNASQNRLIREVDVAENNDWQAKILKTIEFAYKKAPHFSEIFPLITNVISADLPAISERAYLSIRLVCNYLDIQTSFTDTSSIYGNNNLKGQNRILDICKKEGAHHYINPIGGMEIYSRPLFEDAGVKINFIKTLPVVYNQFSGEFVANLSIIDSLMFNTRLQMRQLLSQYQLI